MNLSDKMSYLKGLVDGMELDLTTKEGKVLGQLLDVLQETVLYVTDLQDQVDELTELCESLDEDLGDVEDSLASAVRGSSSFPGEKREKRVSSSSGSSILVMISMMLSLESGIASTIRGISSASKPTSFDAFWIISWNSFFAFSVP